MTILKFYKCKDHGGGQFTIPARVGRPPVRCTEDNPCSRADVKQNELRDKVRSLRALADRELEKAPAEAAIAESNTSLAPAKAAKEKLLALGWTAEGKAGLYDHGDGWATVTASRGSETLILNWSNGEIVAQDYSLSTDTETVAIQDGGIPGREGLGFDPDELTDRELVDRIRGMKVTWWNSLGGSRVQAVVGTKVSIEHIFDQGNTYDSTKRLVKFVDREAGGFRAFHVSALLKVG